MLNREAMVKHKAEGRDAALPLDKSYVVRPDFWNATVRQICEAIGVVVMTGDMCAEGTVIYGASTITDCSITLPDDFTEVDDYLTIGDGSRVWRVKVAIENEITFSDTNLISGTPGSNNYNTIRDSLIMWTLSKNKLAPWITKNEIALGEFNDALHGDDIMISKIITTTLKDLYDAFDLEHEADGKHSAGIIENAMLDKDDVLITQGFMNRCINGEFNINGAVSRDYWNDILTPVVTPTAGSKADFPQWYAKIDTNALDEGIFQALGSGYEPGVPIRKCFYAKGDAGGELIKAILVTSADIATEEITLTTAWEIYYVDLTPTDLTAFEARIVSNTAAAQTFYIAMITVANGDVHTLPERAPIDLIHDVVLQDTFFVDDITVVSDVVFAQWDLLKNIKILQVDVICQKTINADIIIRITDGATDHDTTILNGNSTAQNTADQDYNKAATMQIKILAGTATVGDNCIITIQYRTR